MIAELKAKNHSYLQFDKGQMTNLQISMTKEILLTNRLGGFCSTTVLGCNIRKYNGLLVLPVPQLDNESHVLLSSLDETVVQHGVEFNLGIHKFQGENYSPKGHKYIVRFVWDKVPTVIYRVGGVILQKEIVFMSNDQRVMIRYTLLDAHSATLLRLRPFTAFRLTCICRRARRMTSITLPTGIWALTIPVNGSAAIPQTRTSLRQAILKCLSRKERALSSLPVSQKSILRQ